MLKVLHDKIEKKRIRKGLSALFGDQNSESNKDYKVSINRANVSIGDLSPNKYQPRVNFDQKKLEEPCS